MYLYLSLYYCWHTHYHDSSLLSLAKSILPPSLCHAISFTIFMRTVNRYLNIDFQLNLRWLKEISCCWCFSCAVWWTLCAFTHSEWACAKYSLIYKKIFNVLFALDCELYAYGRVYVLLHAIHTIDAYNMAHPAQQCCKYNRKYRGHFIYILYILPFQYCTAVAALYYHYLIKVNLAKQ